MSLGKTLKGLGNAGSVPLYPSSWSLGRKKKETKIAG